MTESPASSSEPSAIEAESSGDQPRVIEADLYPGAVATRLEYAINWFRESSIWYLLFATA